MRFSVEIYRFVVSEAEDRNEKEGKDYEKERERGERAKKLAAGREEEGISWRKSLKVVNEVKVTRPSRDEDR